MGLTRGSLILPRMNAHRLVIIAAAFTIAVAAALATALVTVSSQALPRAVRHDLSRAAGTSFVIGGNATADQGARFTSLLPGKISAALEGAPFAFYRAYRSDPLGFVPGSRPALEQVNPDSPLFWAGGVIADPDQFGAFQGAFGGTGLALQLEFPLNAGGMNADQAHGLYNSLNRAAAVTPTLTGALAPAADSLTVTSPLLQDLALFLGTQAAVEPCSCSCSSAWSWSARR